MSERLTAFEQEVDQQLKPIVSIRSERDPAWLKENLGKIILEVLFAYFDNGIATVLLRTFTLRTSPGGAAAAAHLIEKEIEKNPIFVGPPIAIVELTPSGYRWLRQGLCPRR